MQFLAALVLFLTTTSLAAANCNFVSADYIDELSNPKYIGSIKVTVPKSAKFAQNFLKIAISNTYNIPPKLKKNFKAKIEVNYPFGKCSYDATVKQSGDLKDHIAFLPGGKITRSLKIKLKQGNIANAVRFKLLIPETRNDLNEVFATVLLRALGFIAPETFKVDVNMNGVKSSMLFQEEAQKELLERNFRREGPIYEGDETLLWGKGLLLENDTISLARTTNKNWFLKGNTSAKITTEAYKRLQMAYLTRVDNPEFKWGYIQPNMTFRNIFHDFHFISIALRAEHGLHTNNRKYYFNVFLDEFEPIYYDGNIELENKSLTLSEVQKNDNFTYSFSKGYKFASFGKLDDPRMMEKVIDDFVARAKLSKEKSTSLAKRYWDKFRENAHQLQNLIDQSNLTNHYDKMKSTTYQAFISRVKNSPNQQKNILEVKQIQDGVYPIVWENGTTDTITPEELADLISEMSFDGERAVLVDKNIRTKQNDFTIQEFSSGHVILSAGIGLDINEASKQIQIKQTTSTDWILFSRNDLSDWKIVLMGQSSDEAPQGQRFNEFGMTGCLNFYEVTFSGANIETNHGACEDSVNIVKSKGFLSNITVQNAMSDAIDIDFSQIQIDNLDVENAGNDCFDVSGGSYEINKFTGINCGDKGISVGESSKLVADFVTMNNAFLGVSSKDLSDVTINNAVLSDVKTCFEAAQKKQEFGGGLLNIKVLKCIGTSNVDEASRAVVNVQ